MADANKRRQRRHDSCMATTRCPKCRAWPGRECHEVRPAWTSRIYPRGVMQRAVQQQQQQIIQTAGMQMGKTLTSAAMLAGKIGRSDWGRQLGGLHKERWAVWEGRSAVERLGELLGD